MMHILEDYDITKQHGSIIMSDSINDDIVDRYCSCMMISGKSKKTIYQYKRAIRRFAEFIRMSLVDIGTYEIRYYLVCEKERGLSNRSLENIRSILSAFYGWMFNEEIISKNPFSKVQPIKYSKKLKKGFSEVEIDAIRSSCRSNRDRAIVEVLLSSGVRVSELVNMDVSDVNFNNMSVHVRHGKGDKDWFTYLNNIAAIHLDQYLRSRSERGNALFYNKRHDRLKPGGVRLMLNQLGESANVEMVHPHKFRRTFATRLASRGMNIHEIRKLLGHSNINTTLEYISVDDYSVELSYRRLVA